MSYPRVTVAAAMLLAVQAGLTLVAGCQQSREPAADVQTKLEIQPTPPQVGEAALALALADAAGRPIEGAALEVEGNMNHAGMKPVFATLRETEPGRYEGKLEFTMGGDWFLLLTGELADGRRVDEKIDVPGVKSP